MCWDNEGGQYQGVKAFGDKPWLMTRKSEVALIYAGPLAHRGKAVCYTKETPNLLRNMLNIPLLLGTNNSVSLCVLYMGAIQNSLQACILFHSWFFRENQRELEGKSGLLVWLLDGRKISFGHSVGWFLLNWNRLLGALGLYPHHSLESQS